MHKLLAAALVCLPCAAMAAPPFDEDFRPLNGQTTQSGTAPGGMGLFTKHNEVQIAGPWDVGSESYYRPDMAKLSLTDPTGLGDKEQGYLTLTTVKDGDRRLGGETQTTSLPGYGFGYYETRMIVDPEHAVGACLSYFWKEGGHKDGHRLYGEGEIDIEFLANEDWATHPEKNGKVHFSLHPSHQSHTVDLPFNPSTGYHRYGFIWTADKVVFTADGVAIHTMVDPYLSHVPPEGGWIMANVWSGAWVWGGGPPETPLSAVYNRMVFYPGATEIEDLKPLAP